MARNECSFREALSEIKARYDIVSVVSRYLSLKKSGRNFTAKCPFHDDRSPSMSVSSERGRYKCFSCGASGDLFQFLAEYRKLSFSEVVHELARELGLKIAERSPDPESELLLRLHALAASAYSQQLSQHETSLNYLHSQRGLRPETVAHFQLGWSPTQGDFLLRYLRDQLPEEPRLWDEDFLIERSGLCLRNRRSGALIDRFRGRLMIPIHDGSGQVVAFGARGEEPKYLNSPETAIYTKGQHLYGLHLARQAARERGRVLLLEGYFDVCQAHQHGFGEAVGCLGTALTDRQAQQLYATNSERRIILGFDGDDAGRRALLASLPRLHAIKGNSAPDLRVMSLPEPHKDVDEHLRLGGELEVYLSGAPEVYDHLLSGVSAEELGEDERRRRVNDLAETVAPAADPLRRELVAEKLARAFGFTKGAVLQIMRSREATHPAHLEEARSPRPARPSGSRSSRSQALRKPKIDCERSLVALLLVSADTNILDLVRSAELADSELASQRDSLLELSLPQRHQQASPSLRLVAKMLSESGIEVDEIAANCLAELGDDRKKAFSALRRRCKM